MTTMINVIFKVNILKTVSGTVDITRFLEWELE